MPNTTRTDRPEFLTLDQLARFNDLRGIGVGAARSFVAAKNTIGTNTRGTARAPYTDFTKR